MTFTVRVQVKPGSAKGPHITVGDDSLLIVYVNEPAQEGKANKAAIKVLAEHFGIPSSCVILSKGASARYKTFTILAEKPS